MIGFYSSQGLGNHWQGSFPLQGMSIGGNPSHTKWNPRHGSIPMLGGSTWGILNQGPCNIVQGEIPTQPMSSNYRNQLTMETQAQAPFTRWGHHGFFQNP
jgi:hypothetical protein